MIELLTVTRTHIATEALMSRRAAENGALNHFINLSFESTMATAISRDGISRGLAPVKRGSSDHVLLHHY